MLYKRKKHWEEKVILVRGSFNRAKDTANFAHNFYENLFFLNPKIKNYFENTDFEHQTKALMSAMEFMLDFLDHSNQNARRQVIRISQTHAKKNLNIHPHDYYYWTEALVMTLKKHDPNWYEGLAFYWREVIYYPISFMISQYYQDS